MSIELKIKSKHLAEEARIIKFEEAKCKKYGNYETLNSLCNHRKFDVRNENRATFLARAYIAGKPYKSVEQSRHPAREDNFQYYVVRRILAMVQKYGNRQTTKEDILAWINA